MTIIWPLSRQTFVQHAKNGKEKTVQSSRRIDTIDFWRGIVLVVIFINHVPGNIIEHITPRNFGFSDSAEAFVFISGLAVALAYGRDMESGRLGAVVGKSWRRAFVLYSIHLLLTFSAISLFATAFVLTGNEAFITSHGRDTVLEDPSAALVGILSLGHQIGYYNILPLYILLMVITPLLLASVRRSPMLTLVVSFVIYAIAQAPQVNLPSWPVPGLWFLNPFAWQFAFVIGVITGQALKKGQLSKSQPLFCATLVFVLIAPIVMSNMGGLMPGLYDSLRALGGFDKTDMSAMRLAHFLALAYVLYHANIGKRLLATPIGAPAALMGRHGLAIFALGSVLSSAGQVCIALAEEARFTNATMAGIIVVPAGIMCLYFFARYLEGAESAALPATREPIAATT